MKRLFCMFFCLVLLLPGCSAWQPEDNGQAISFYYLRSTPQYQAFDGIICGQPVQRTDLPETLEAAVAVYLSGPSDQSLQSPFPEGTELKALTQENGRIYITFSNQLKNLDSYRLTLACACITKTLLGLTTAQSVQIRVEAGPIYNDEIYILMTNEDLVLLDNYDTEN